MGVLDVIIELPTAWVSSIDIGYWVTPLPDKLSAEDRSLLIPIILPVSGPVTSLIGQTRSYKKHLTPRIPPTKPLSFDYGG